MKKPRTKADWERLARLVLARQEQVGDLRDTNAIKFALAQGTIETLLRRRGIICEADVERTYPLE